MSAAPETFFTLRGAPLRAKTGAERDRDRDAETIPAEKMARLNPRDAPVHVGGTGGGSGKQMSILAMTLLGFGALVAVLIASNVASIVQMREIRREFDRLGAVKETSAIAAEIDRGLAELRLAVGEFLAVGDETSAAFAALVVEDDAFVRRSLVRMLRAMGFVEVKEAGDGEEAFKTLKSMPQCGVVLCDIGMKTVGGLQFLERLRGEVSGPLAEAPVIFITGSANSETVKRAMSMKAAGYVLRPVVPEKLSQRLAATLKIGGG
jgi:two-component system chemotaxis response regulator CheY